MSKTKETTGEVSEAKAAFQALVDTYAKQNPVKYELKKAELEAKLAQIQ